MQVSSLIQDDSLLNDSNIYIQTVRDLNHPVLPIGQVSNPNKISIITLELSQIQEQTPRKFEERTLETSF